MEKYLRVAKNTWAEVFNYRISFAIWRFRNVLGLITLYFLWTSLIPTQGNLFGYDQSQIITYIIGAFLVTAIVLSSRTQEIGENINSGDLSTFLIRPMNYFGYWFAKRFW